MSFHYSICLAKLFPLIAVSCLCNCVYLLVDEHQEKSTNDSDCDNQTIGIACLSVLLAVAVVCIVGLVIWNVRLNKKLAHTKSKEM